MAFLNVNYIRKAPLYYTRVNLINIRLCPGVDYIPAISGIFDFRHENRPKMSTRSQDG